LHLFAVVYQGKGRRSWWYGPDHEPACSSLNPQVAGGYSRAVFFLNLKSIDSSSANSAAFLRDLGGQEKYLTAENAEKAAEIAKNYGKSLGGEYV
jgi:hypothetical protein